MESRKGFPLPTIVVTWIYLYAEGIKRKEGKAYDEIETEQENQVQSHQKQERMRSRAKGEELVGLGQNEDNWSSWQRNKGSKEKHKGGLSFTKDMLTAY